MAYQFTHNYTMLCDFYEFTMSNGYFQNGLGERTVYFDMFSRMVPVKRKTSWATMPMFLRRE